MTNPSPSLSRFSLVLLAVLAGCGGVPPTPAPVPDVVVDGIGLRLAPGSTAEDWQKVYPDLNARVIRVIDAAAAYGRPGHDHTDLSGWVIAFEESIGVDCEGWNSAACTHHEDGQADGWIDIAAGHESGITTPEDSPLAHEILHAMIGDPGHCDPRWRDFGPVYGALKLPVPQHSWTHVTADPGCR